MPTTRCGHVRKLMKEKKAVPICNEPFTIRLKYETPEIVQPLYLGLDTGRENIGIAVSKENGNCCYLSELETKNKSIKEKMSERREHRSERRRHKRIKKQRRAIKSKTAIQNGDDDKLRTKKDCKSKKVIYPGMEEGSTHKVIQGAEAQFNNRKKEEGWLPPSGRQLIQMHANAINSVMKILPISHIALEKVSFDFQKLENQNIKTWEYGKGSLYGFNSYKDYIHSEQNGICLLCGKKAIEYYHHIIPRHEDGSDNVKNIAGLCYDCHYGKDGVHKNPEATEQLKDKKEGLRQKYKVGLLNSVMPALIEEVDAFCKENQLDFSVTDGHTTSETRKHMNLPKEHCIDAYCISIHNRTVDCNMMPSIIYEQRHFKKKSNNNIHKRNNREYYVKVKETVKVKDTKTDKETKQEIEKLVLVAKNKHKATEQDFPSLEEHLLEYTETHTEEETLTYAKNLIVKPCRRTYTFHKKGIISPFHPGDTIKYEKKNKQGEITQTEIFIADGIDVFNNQIKNGTKRKHFKFCKRIDSSSIPIIGKRALRL